MTTRLIFSLTLLFNALGLKSQVTDCNCAENLGRTILKTEENYAGYPTKVNTATAAVYVTLVEKLKQKAAHETDPKKCYYLLREYVQFFRDRHFIISYIADKNFDSTVINFSESEIKKAFLSETSSPVEGIWVDAANNTTIAIRKASDGTFNAVKVDSKIDSFPKGFVYFNLAPRGSEYIVRSFNSFVSTDFPAKQTGHLLRLWNHAVWGKVFPQKMTATEREELSTWKNNNNGLAFKKIQPDVCVLKIPSFYNNDNNIIQLVAAADSAIRNTKYLIVDLTGNGGGNTGWIYFLPYFMTNPIHQESPLLRVTPDNVRLKLPELEYFVKDTIAAEYKKYFPEHIIANYKKAYRELPATKEKFYPIPTVIFPLDSITRNPQKIALLVDNFSGSSAEYFLYLSRQSKKTITYGSNTLGMMDFEGISTPTTLPFRQFILTIPIAKSGWTDKKPIDRTGFTPNVVIQLPQEQWLDFIVRDLPKR